VQPNRRPHRSAGRARELERLGVAGARLPAVLSAVALAEVEALAKVGRPGAGGRIPIPPSLHCQRSRRWPQKAQRGSIPARRRAWRLWTPRDRSDESLGQGSICGASIREALRREYSRGLGSDPSRPSRSPNPVRGAYGRHARRRHTLDSLRLLRPPSVAGGIGAVGDPYRFARGKMPRLHRAAAFEP